MTGNQPMMTRMLGGAVERLGFLSLGNFDQPTSLPEQPRHHASGEHATVIERIGHAMVQDRRAKPLEEDAPDGEMAADFPRAGWLIIRAEADPAINEKVNRQGDRDGQAVVEMAVKKGRVGVEVRFDPQAIDDIDRQAEKKNRVAPVTERAALFSRHKG
jgi:hypothetical protein